MRAAQTSLRRVQGDAITSRIDAIRAQAQRLQQSGDLTAALAKYEVALALAPLDPELLADLAELAGRIGLHEAAMTLWGRLLEVEPDRLQAFDGFARSLRDLHRYDEAVAVLQQVIPDHQGDSRLWNTLGTVLNQSGEAQHSIAFFSEAVRVDPASAVARYNLGGARLDLGDLEGAQADLLAARALSQDPRHSAIIDFAISTLKLALGEIGEGWDAYRVRHSEHYDGYVEFKGQGRPWTPGERLEGRRLLVIAEQGLGDELMFANMLPDVIAAVGPAGAVTVAVEARLTPLFERSFPTAKIIGHATDRSKGRPVRSSPAVGEVDLWAPMGSLALQFRRAIEDFPQTPAYLTADPERVSHWRKWLGESASLGLSWRSGKTSGERRKLYPPISTLTPLLRAPDVTLVNLQYDVGQEELDQLSTLAGRPVLQPPGLDIRNDLDDLAALTVALTHVVSIANATAALAGACGANIAIISGPKSWAKLGAERLPWYPRALSLSASLPGAWDEPMSDAAAWLHTL